MSSQQAIAVKTLKQAGIRATPLRIEVLNIMLQAKSSLSAYDILELLIQVHPAVKPMTVYRTLHTFENVHLVHKLEKNNSYVLCCHPNEAHSCQIIICDNCSTYTEIHDDRLAKHIADTIKRSGFATDQTTIELSAVCNECRAA